MTAPKMIKTFHDRYPFVGPGMWILSVQYFLVQLIVAIAWPNQFSLAYNTISDLGNTVCGIYGSRYVCSPLHISMNISFIILGLFMSLGSILIYQEFKKSHGSRVGFSFMAIAGIGTAMVGIFPENTINQLHSLGAFMPFLIGNLAIIILGLILDLPKSIKNYSVLSGVIALVALVFFITHNYLGIGIGGMERIVAYPQTIWLIVFGIYISKNRVSKRINKK